MDRDKANRRANLIGGIIISLLFGGFIAFFNPVTTPFLNFSSAHYWNQQLWYVLAWDRNLTQGEVNEMLYDLQFDSYGRHRMNHLKHHGDEEYVLKALKEAAEAWNPRRWVRAEITLYELGIDREERFNRLFELYRRRSRGGDFIFPEESTGFPILNRKFDDPEYVEKYLWDSWHEVDMLFSHNLYHDRDGEYADHFWDLSLDAEFGKEEEALRIFENLSGASPVYEESYELYVRKCQFGFLVTMFLVGLAVRNAIILHKINQSDKID